MNRNLKKASMSIRVGYTNWHEEEKFAKFLALLKRYEGFTDEITFFTSETHPPLPLAEFERRTLILKERMAAARKEGFGTGINILATIGHHEENLENSLSQEYQHLTDPAGNICRGAICPIDPKSKEYIKKLYEWSAKAEPDYIWIDDDVRLSGHKPILHTCFCDGCLGIFKDEFGVGYTREELAAACSGIEVDKSMEIRKKWLQHNRNTISNLFRMIEKTVSGIDAKIVLGFMTGDRFFEGYDFNNWAGILSGTNGREVTWRPGGGFYDENVPSDLFMKSHDIGRQISKLPDEIVRIQSEIENFPYQLYRKTPAFTRLEAASHIAAGCTGAAYNILSEQDVDHRENEMMIRKLHAARPFYDLLVSKTGRSKPQGIYTGWNIDSQLAIGVGGNWFRGGVDNGFAGQFYQLGMPAAYAPENATVTLLSGNSVYAMSREEILSTLSKGVYMDSQALNALNSLGYGEYTGFTIKEYIPVDCSERMLDHAINAGFAGTRRDARQSFYAFGAASLVPADPQAEIISCLIDYAWSKLGDCAIGIFENKLGGRICISGYYPWTFLMSLTKSTQMKRLIRWTAKDDLPGFIGSYHRMNLWARQTPSGKPSFILANSSLMETEGLELFVRTEGTKIVLAGMDCIPNDIVSVRKEGPYRIFEIPSVKAMELVLAYIE